MNFIIFSSFLPFTNLLFGVIGGLVGSLIGRFGKKESIRWSASFALIGIFCTYIFLRYSGTKELILHQDIYIFAPLFAMIGVVGSGIFKFQIDDVGWRLLILFPLVGIVAALLYQSRGVILWLVVLGSISGGLVWYLANPRLRWSFLFAGMGIILASTLLIVGHSRNFNLLVISLGGIIGGLVGWLTQDRTIKWIIVLVMLGMLVGSVVEFIYVVWGLLPILFGGVIGAASGLVIKGQHYREIIGFMMFGGVFFCSIKLGWDTIQFLEAMWRMP